MPLPQCRSRSVPFGRRALLQSALVIGIGAVAPRARACEFEADGFTVEHPWVLVADPGAVSTALCMGFHDIRQGDRLIGVETPLALRAELGGRDAGTPLAIDIAPGADFDLSPDGPHVRLLDLQYPVLMGRQFPLTLVFERSGRLTATMFTDYTFR